MIRAEFRPIESWPETLRPDGQRTQSRFSATWGQTLHDMESELKHLHAKDIVIELALRSTDIRADGWPRSNARTPDHPGIIVSFGSAHGPLRYFTDAFKGGGNHGYLPGWQANVRAIALGLEALRTVDRYGITKRGEQYTGFSALPPGAIPGEPASMTLDEAIAFLDDHSMCAWDFDDPEAVQSAYREAAKILHPDAGGSTEMFKRLTIAKEMLDREMRS